MLCVSSAKFCKGCAIIVALLIAAAGMHGCGGGDDGAPTRGGGSDQPGGAGGVSSAILEWDPPTTGNSPSGYRIYYGTAPGVYFQPFGQGVDVRNVTTYTVTGLGSGTRYFFAATTYDNLNNESAYSNEVFKDVP